MASTIYGQVVGVISKSPCQRNLLEVQNLIPWFRKKSELFAPLTTDVVTDIIRNCEFVTHEQDDVIIKQGEKGHCFYILLRGRVSIYINNAISDEEDPTKAALKIQSADAKTGLDRSKHGNLIGYFDAGKSFGELALLSRESARNATILAEETADLLVVPRDLYDRSLKAAQEAEFDERIRFVQESPLFRAWQPRYKRQMAMSIVKLNQHFDEPITKQGDPTSHLYFIIRGQAKLVVDPDQHSAQYPHLENRDWSSHEDDVTQCLSPGRENKLHLPPSARRKREVNRRQLEICLIGENDIIGDTEFVLDLKTHMQSAVCTQTCRIYSLDMRNYERLVLRRNPKTVELLRAQVEMKLHGRVLRALDIKMPLLRVLLQRVQRQIEAAKRPEWVRPSVSPGTNINHQRGSLIDHHHGSTTMFHRDRYRDKTHVNGQQKASAAYHGYSLQAHHHAVPRTERTFFDEGQEDAEVLLNETDAVGASLGLDEMQSCGNYYFEDSPRKLVDASDASVLRSRQRPLYASFDDWESSDRVLTDLEARLEAWHTAPSTAQTGLRNATHPFRMRRLAVEDGKDIKPGIKVVLRKKQQTKTGQDNGLLTTVFSSSSSTSTRNGRDDSSGHITSRKDQPGKVEVKYAKPQCNFAFGIPKRRSLNEYTVEDYLTLKRILAWRERSMMTTTHGLAN